MKTDPEWEALVASFVESLKERRIELIQLETRLPIGDLPLRCPEVTTLHFHAHKLSGIAESYGFAEVGDAGREVDDGIVALKDQGASAVPREQVVLWVQRLLGAIERGIPENRRS